MAKSTTRVLTWVLAFALLTSALMPFAVKPQAAHAATTIDTAALTLLQAQKVFVPGDVEQASQTLEITLVFSEGTVSVWIWVGSTALGPVVREGNTIAYLFVQGPDSAYLNAQGLAAVNNVTVNDGYGLGEPFTTEASSFNWRWRGFPDSFMLSGIRP